MARSVLIVVILVVAVIWLPWWAQLTLFVGSIFVIPQPLLLILPAIISDALYAPGTGTWISNMRVTLVVLVVVGLYSFIIRKMRVAPLYALETKN